MAYLMGVQSEETSWRKESAGTVRLEMQWVTAQLGRAAGLQRLLQRQAAVTLAESPAPSPSVSNMCPAPHLKLTSDPYRGTAASLQRLGTELRVRFLRTTSAAA